MGNLLRVILSAQSSKAWVAFLAPIVIAIIGAYTGYDIGNCGQTVTDVAVNQVGPAIGEAIGPAVTGLVTGGPLGAITAIAVWFAKNRLKKA